MSIIVTLALTYTVMASEMRMVSRELTWIGEIGLVARGCIGDVFSGILHCDDFPTNV